ncbi:MAG TPA: PP2C family protein-serine/threonine phosphatase [Bacteroidia bacterium]|nr:PP2C family protein-serine/threonine phosphatase [Bacteroidia bacterium]
MTTTSTDSILQELESKKLQLHWLLQITKAINYNLPTEGLYEIYRSVLENHLKVGRMLLLVHDGEWRIATSYNASTESIELGALAEDLLTYSADPAVQISIPSGFETIVPVVHQDRPLAFALIGGVEEQMQALKRETVTYIHTITNVIVVAIENKRLAKESVRRAVMQRELDMAAQMQAMLFPTDLVSNSMLDIAATYIPHSQVGGDYYDFIPIGDNKALVCMADVSGKGMAAALLMSNFQANLHALVKHTDSLPDIIRELNERVFKTAKGDRFITFFIACIDTVNGKINYINAGHHPPLLLNNSNILPLDNGTTGLGMFDELPFLHTGEVEYQDNALLFCYTDGVTEMEDSEGVALGLDTLAELIKKHQDAESMNHMHNNMVTAFDLFRKEQEFNDDVTFLSLRLFKRLK